MTDTLRGYTRDPEMSEQIISAIRDALDAHPNQRLGQIIDNALRISVGESANLFQIYDETLVESLRRFTRE